MSSEIYFAEIDGIEYQIEIISDSIVSINGSQHNIDYEPIRQGSSYSILLNGKSFEPNIFLEDDSWEILLEGKRFTVKIEDERERRLRLASGISQTQTESILIQSPMPGLVIDIPVEEGERVEKDQVLVILESMKMQNELRAPRAGKITRIQASVNDNVERRETLLTLE